MYNSYDTTIPPFIAHAVEEMKRKGQLPEDFMPRRIDADIETEETEIDLAEILDRETAFRFAYVPFVIAQLVWDYTDTITTMAALMKIRQTRPLSRTINDLQREYDRARAPYIDDNHITSEIDNMYIFEDGVKHIFSLYIVNLRADLKREYPALTPEYTDFMIAVYQALILLKALMLYVDGQTARVQKIIGRPIGRIMPEQLYRLLPLIEAYIGDKPISPTFRLQQDTYIKTLANQMSLIGLNDE